MDRWSLLLGILVLSAASGASAAIGYADSWPPKPLDTTPPVFAALAATPDRAMAGDVVSITFTVSKALAADPAVLVNGIPAIIIDEKSGGGFSCLYHVPDTAPAGPAFIEISGEDPVGNMGLLNDETVLEIMQTPPGMPLGWRPLLGAFLLGVASLFAMGGRLKRGVCPAAPALLTLIFCAVAAAQAPEVSNVDFNQGRAPAGGTQVVVSYDLVAPNGPCAVYLSLSQQLDDDDFISTIRHYTGDIANMTTGAGRQIVWEVARDYPNAYLAEARIRVTADDEPTPHTVTYTAGANGSISGQATQFVDHGETGAPVTAEPNEHYIFLEWSDGLQTATRQDGNITTDFSVTATFAPFGYNAIFLEGDDVRIPTIHRTPGAWRVLDDKLEELASGVFAAGDACIDLGELPIGWYRIEFPDEAGDVFTTAAVLAPLKVAPSPDTPVAVDIAMSWSPGDDPAVWRNAARAAQLAGVRTVRDRIDWRHFQPTEGPMPAHIKYDDTAAIQQEHGLQLVQVFHNSPTWTRDHSEDAGRMPPDLRHTWEFCRAMAERYSDTVQVWQPWNEGNASNFGRHTIDELCSHQKAAYWGFKTGNPNALVSWAPLGGINSDGLCQGIQDNGTLPYYDLYALHCYNWPTSYARVREAAFETASGKPVWVTESDRGMLQDPSSPYNDLSHENERRKAMFMTESIATSLSTGVQRNFHFLLRQYGATNQYGLLRHDDTPRMTYVALAAAGRFLADAQYLGSVVHDHGQDVHLFVFRARPDGVPSDVLVAWTERRVEWAQRGNAQAAVDLPSSLVIRGVWDYLGRPLGAFVPDEATSAPLFIVMPVGQAAKLALDAYEPPTPTPHGPPSPVVLQLRVPVGTRKLAYRLHNWTPEHDRAMDPGTHELIVAAYHFGEGPVSGTIAIDALPEGWTANPDSWAVALEPMERHDQTVWLTIPEPGPCPEDGAWTSFQGEFGAAGAPRLAFRAMPE